MLDNFRYILLCGIGPLPVDNPDRLYAPGLRLWSFIRALLAVECQVDILDVHFESAATGEGALLHQVRPPRAVEPMPQSERHAFREVGPGILLRSGPVEKLAAPGLRPLVRHCLAANPYDAVVSNSDIMNDACVHEAGDMPLWCDFNGHPMAERQSMAAQHGSDGGLIQQWDMVLPALLRADRFSECSAAGRNALVGEVGACGRLNRWTDGQPLVENLPEAFVFNRQPEAGPSLFRGGPVPGDAFVVLWSGGYNTWSDPDTLAEGLMAAMRRDPRIYYVSTGGKITGHDSLSFQRFRERVDASELGDRFHFAGWVETQDVPRYYREADLGLNCERAKLEGELGARNRVLDWVGAGLPVLSTDVCEQTNRLAERQLIETYPCGDASALSDALLSLAAAPQATLQDRAERAKVFLEDAFSPERLGEPLAKWCLQPERSMDIVQGLRPDRERPFIIPDNTLARRRAAEWLNARRSVPRRLYIQACRFLGYEEVF